MREARIVEAQLNEKASTARSTGTAGTAGTAAAAGVSTLLHPERTRGRSLYVRHGLCVIRLAEIVRKVTRWRREVRIRPLKSLELADVVGLILDRQQRVGSRGPGRTSNIQLRQRTSSRVESEATSPTLIGDRAVGEKEVNPSVAGSGATTGVLIALSSSLR